MYWLLVGETDGRSQHLATDTDPGNTHIFYARVLRRSFRALFAFPLQEQNCEIGRPISCCHACAHPELAIGRQARVVPVTTGWLTELGSVCEPQPNKYYYII